MADLAVTVVNRNGATVNPAAADVAGDKFINTGKEFIYIQNDDVASKTVTLDVTQTVDGLALPDRAYNVNATSKLMIGPIPPEIYNDVDGKVRLTYSAITNLKVQILQLSKYSA